MVSVLAFAHLALVDKADDVLVLLRMKFAAKLDFINLLALEKLFFRYRAEVKHLDEIHHIVRAEFRI